ncbi:MAG TPA: DNA gyrase inhibitor YacG [Nevskiales bacterium]|nr:DNA gyrase inhibitor YacG [Nevskiales bacterium]
MAATARIGRCPRCGKSVPLTADNPWRPFCSERCKTVDLGDWLSERHRIAGEQSANQAPSKEPD